MPNKPTSNPILRHDPFYRLGVGMMIVNYNGQVLVCQRMDVEQKNGSVAWQMPQGGIDFEEEPLAAALRELKEEIGTAQVSMLAELEDWLSYDFPERLAKTLWGGRFVGQRQKWFLFRYEGYDSDINLDASPHREFIDYKWVNPQDLPNLIVDFKKELYSTLVSKFNPILQNLDS